MSQIMGLIGPEHLEIFAFEFENFYFSLCLHSNIYNINQSAPNLVKIHMTIRYRMSLIMGLIGPEHVELFTLELEILLYFTLCTL